jgi:hypothetical protein
LIQEGIMKRETADHFSFFFEFFICNHSICMQLCWFWLFELL